MTDIKRLTKAWEIFRDSNPYQICDGKEFRAIKEPEYCMGQMIDDTLALLKEQKPIKPTVAAGAWICSKCGHSLESQDLIEDKENPQVLVHERYQYCPNCGRAVKWK